MCITLNTEDDPNVFAEVEWFDFREPAASDAADGIFLEQVVRNPESNFNARNRWIYLVDVEPQNFMIAKHAPFDEECDVYDVLGKNIYII